jgi:hypothetical protein
MLQYSRQPTALLCVHGLDQHQHVHCPCCTTTHLSKFACKPTQTKPAANSDTSRSSTPPAYILQVAGHKRWRRQRACNAHAKQAARMRGKPHCTHATAVATLGSRVARLPHQLSCQHSVQRSYACRQGGGGRQVDGREASLLHGMGYFVNDMGACMPTHQNSCTRSQSQSTTMATYPHTHNIVNPTAE